MKKEVSFDLFGDNTDYLYFGLKELKRAQDLTPNKKVNEIVPPLFSGEYSIDYILGLLKIGLSKCWQEKNRNFDNIEKMFEDSMENEEITLAVYASVLYRGILASGFFGLTARAEKEVREILTLLGIQG